MENLRAVYINTFAEGSRSSEPTHLTTDELKMAARGWKRAKTIIHVHMLGMQEKRIDGTTREFLVGDIGPAKVMLPVDPEYSGLEEGQDPLTLTDRWICGMVEDFDLQDEGDSTILINRKKGLERLRELNAERVSKPGNRATGVIIGIRRGAYVLDVGGYTALLPKVWYDWDQDKRDAGTIGEEFPVQIQPTKVADRIVVSRCHLMENPNVPSSLRFERGTILRAKVAVIRNGLIRAEVYPGFHVSVDPVLLREIPKPGDRITVRILGQNKNGYYGMMLDHKRQGVS
ncbi:MAG: 4-hydroxy-3-methylbut-2-enyl diphosphate reductase [Alicyclobacillus sp.]|nr:4-hydroxy-3-methylbut-2-enyl diphosphate reductase [Alicyclobacillus sp.]